MKRRRGSGTAITEVYGAGRVRVPGGNSGQESARGEVVPCAEAGGPCLAFERAETLVLLAF